MKSETSIRPTTSASYEKSPTVQELDEIKLADHGSLARKHEHARPQTPQQAYESSNKYSRPRTPDELERSEPPTPKQDAATPMLPNFWFPTMNRWRILAASFEYFGNGMSDSAPGALIPYIEDWYNIGYAVVSLIWITNAVGFILSAFFNDAIQAKLGRAKSLHRLCISRSFTTLRLLSATVRVRSRICSSPS